MNSKNAINRIVRKSLDDVCRESIVEVSDSVLVAPRNADDIADEQEFLLIEDEVPVTSNFTFSDYEFDSATLDDYESDGSSISLTEDAQSLSLHELYTLNQCTFNVPRAYTQSLLDILHRHVPGIQLPKSHYLFTKIGSDELTASKLTTSNPQSETAYYSISNNIRYLISNGILVSRDQTGNPHQYFDLTFNIDGLPIYKSSSTDIWPILIDVNGMNLVLPVALYMGKKKPDFHLYLKPLIDEILELKTSGLDLNSELNLKLRNVTFVLDAPAKSSVLFIESHNSKNGCPYCRCESISINRRMCFPTTPGISRSDHCFHNFLENNQKILSPVTQISSLSDFPVDPQHAIFLGIVRRLMHLYFNKIKSFNVPCRITEDKLSELSDEIIATSKFTPKEFQRKGRRIDTDLKLWKACEFRLMLLYLGPFLFKKFLRKEYYEHFLLLHFSMYVYSSSTLFHLHGCAEDALNLFVQSMPRLFGDHSVSYNFHVALHIPHFVKKFGDLSKFSAWRFENFLGKVKRRLRITRYAFPHIAKQLSLLRQNQIKDFKKGGKGLHFSSRSPDNGAIIEGHPCIVDRVEVDGTVIGHKLRSSRVLYQVGPYDSMLLNIGYYSKSRSLVKGFPSNKCFIIPSKGEFLVIPFAHD